MAEAPRPVPVAKAAPVEQAAARDPDVTIAPFNPADGDYEGDFDVESELRAAFEQDQHAHHSEAPFIPPQAEAPSVRMPKVEDFPPIAQRQMEAHHGGGQPEEDRGPLSLLRRLANVGLGRREEEPAPRPQPQPQQQQRPVQQQPQQQRPKLAAPPPTPQRQPQQQVAAPPPPASDYAKRPSASRAAPPPDSVYRPRQAELDKHGRPLPRDARQIDDELEIPAFLRRQAN